MAMQMLPSRRRGGVVARVEADQPLERPTVSPMQPVARSMWPGNMHRRTLVHALESRNAQNVKDRMYILEAAVMKLQSNTMSAARRQALSHSACHCKCVCSVFQCSRIATHSRRVAASCRCVGQASRTKLKNTFPSCVGSTT